MGIFYRNFLSIFLTLGVVSGAVAQNSPGQYLALRQAFFRSDDATVAQYIEDALRENPDDIQMLEQGIVSDIFYGALGDAHKRVETLAELDHANLYTALTELGYLVNRGDYDDAANFVEGSENLGFISPSILHAWVLADDGDMDGAVALLDRAIAEDADGAPIYQYQQALILAYSGSYPRAAAILGGGGEPLYFSNDSFFAHVAATILAGDENWSALVAATYGDEPSWPYHIKVIAEAAQGGDVPATLGFASPQNAIAEYLRLLLSSGGEDNRDIYIERFFVTLLPRIAPKHDGMWLDSLGYFARTEEDDDLLAYAENIPDKSPFRLLRDNYQSDTNFVLERLDIAREIVDDAPESGLDALIYKANSYRGLDDLPKSVEYYQRALDLVGEDGANWNLLYGYAIAQDRNGDWPAAQSLLDLALTKAPEEPELLNYLGYSLVDRREDVNRGLDLITKAVELAPNSGHILDSLGWAYYRLDRFDEALEPLERASFLIPTEPVVYVHLGDLYWQLGRKDEAQYMWARALVFFNEDTVDITTEDVQARLDSGRPPEL